jgi:PASTA domain
MRALTLIVLVCLACGGAVGCGESETVTVTEEAEPAEGPRADDIEAAAERAARRAVRKERARERARTERERAAQAETEATPEDSAGGIEVPNVVGVDHQLAQDTMQAAGLYLLQEQDCTGQDRFLLWDRNWVVVSQDPPAGSVVNEDATITLCSKKDGE